MYFGVLTISLLNFLLLGLVHGADDYAGNINVNFQFSNTRHRLSSGEKCDPYNYECEIFIKFCVTSVSDSTSSNECDVGIFKTDVSKGKTGKFMGSFDMKIPHYSKGHQLVFTATAYDEDKWDEHDKIATFKSKRAYSFEPNQKSTSIQMERSAVDKNDATLVLGVTLTCNANYYGTSCGKYCAPKEGFYTCSEGGDQICEKGKRSPPGCTEYDYCYLLPCAPDAQCTNVPGGSRKCTCEATDEQKCYKYTPCVPNLCLNGGNCRPSSTEKYEDECDCPDGFVGRRCDSKRDFCDEEAFRQIVLNNDSRITHPDWESFAGKNLTTEMLTADRALLQKVYELISRKEIPLNYDLICQNNGECTSINRIHQLGYKCNCRSGFTGNACEIKREGETNYLSIFTGTLVSLLIIILIVGAGFLIHCQRKRKTKKAVKKRREEIYAQSGLSFQQPGYWMSPVSPQQVYGMPSPMMPPLTYKGSTVFYRNGSVAPMHSPSFIFPHPSQRPALPMLCSPDEDYLTVTQNQEMMNHYHGGTGDEYAYADIKSVIRQMGETDPETVSLPPAPAPPPQNHTERTLQRTLPEVPPQHSENISNQSLESQQKRMENAYLTVPLIQEEMEPETSE